MKILKKTNPEVFQPMYISTAFLYLTNIKECLMGRINNSLLVTKKKSIDPNKTNFLP